MNTGSEFAVTLAWFSAAIATASAVLMLLTALVARYYLQYEERLRVRVANTWRPLLTRSALDDDLPDLPSLPRGHLPFLIEEWNAVHDVLRGEAETRLNRLALQLGLDNAARHMMHSSQIGKRILAIRTLGHLRDPTAWKALQEQLADSNALVSFYAAASLVAIDAQRAMPGIMLQLAERESWPGEAMARLLVDVGADVARDPIRTLMLSLEPTKIPPLLPWLSHVDAVLGSEVALELLHRHGNDAHIVAAALLVLLDPAVLPELRRFADSADADIRKNLAIAVGQLGDTAETDLLTRLLGDRVWWVRYRAGEALLKLRGMTETGLDAVGARLVDPYAIDMLRHVRAEASLS